MKNSNQQCVSCVCFLCLFPCQAALCQCYDFWTCGDRPDGGKFLVRVSLGSLDPPGVAHLVDAEVEVTPGLRGVRILELGGGKIFNKDVMLLGPSRRNMAGRSGK